MTGFNPPPYPYERLESIREVARRHSGGPIECSIGTPIDTPPQFVVDNLAKAEGLRGYPPSIGTLDFRESCADWITRRFGVTLSADEVASCVGTKEFVASLAGFLHLRTPERDTVLFPAVSYPTYAMGATLAGLRSVPVAMTAGKLDLTSIEPSDVERALVLWTNSPSNPTGHLDDLQSVANWGRANGVLVASDECYAEFTWASAPQTILSQGLDGVLAVHSISKRSNLAGIRAGFYSGDRELVHYLRLVRQHAGLMVPGPVQSAVALAYRDDEHVEEQRKRYLGRLSILSDALETYGISAPLPEGSFYLWCHRNGTDGWSLAAELAEISGLVVSPGEFYGPQSLEFVRIAVVQPDEQISLAAERLKSSK
jgi:succinyldiaminopimelate transaminase